MAWLATRYGKLRFNTCCQFAREGWAGITSEVRGYAAQTAQDPRGAGPKGRRTQKTQDPNGKSVKGKRAVSAVQVLALLTSGSGAIWAVRRLGRASFGPCAPWILRSNAVRTYWTTLSFPLADPTYMPLNRNLNVPCGCARNVISGPKR